MIICIIQARAGSTRLPNKVSKLILGKPMLAHQIERVSQSRLIDKIIVATTIKDEDNAVANIAHEAGVDCFRGSELDVLDRFYCAAKEAQADIVIRVTGDCPLSDPNVIDETIEYFLRNSAELDYTSKPTNYPEGLDIEIFSFSVLERAWKEGVKPSEREHVTPYIYNHPEIFRIQAWQQGVEDFSLMHWSVDTPEDFMLVTKIFEELYSPDRCFSKDNVLMLLKEQPHLLLVNKGGTGYEGYKKSLKEDEEFQENKEIYKKIIGFEPEGIIVLSAGTLKDTDELGKAMYRSTKSDEGDCFGVLWGESRVIAAAELARYFPKALIVTTSVRGGGEPTHAEIIRRELVKFSVDPSRIILEDRSENTFSQLGESLKIALDKKWKSVVIVTSEYHIPRVCAMYEHFDELDPKEDLKRVVDRIKFSGAQVAFVAAESILPYRDKKFSNLIKQVKGTEKYQKRLKSEKQGVEMILSGTYGKFQIKKESKAEGKV